jgi:hypothetical protein
MNWSLKTVSTIRKSILHLIEGLDEKAMNHIPTNFNNNLAWHLAHLVAVQQVILYKNSSLPMLVTDEYVNTYRGGTKPEKIITSAEIEEIKGLFLSHLQTAAQDYEGNKFVTYTPWVTRTGIEVGSVDESFSALVFHESTHFGYMMALKRVVVKEMGV